MKNQKNIKAVLLFVSSLTVMAGAIIAPALPAIDNHFSNGESQVLSKLVLTLPGLIIAIIAPIAGYFVDKFGRKQLLIYSLIIYGISGVSGFFINNIIVLLISRAILGFGVAGIMNSATTLIGDYFTGEERQKFLGFQASFMAFGGVVYLNLGGVLSDLSWRGPFLVYSAGIIMLPFAVIHLFEPKNINRNKPITNSEPVKNNILVAFVYFLGFLGMMFFYFIPIQVPFLLKNNTGVSNSLIGLAISLSTLTGAISSLYYGKTKSMFSFSRIYIITFLLMSFGYAIIGFSYSYVLVAVGLTVAGFGAGLLMPNGTLWLLEITTESVRGRIVGGFSSSVFLGQFISPIAIAPLLKVFSINNTFFVASSAMVFLSLIVFLIFIKRRSS